MRTHVRNLAPAWAIFIVSCFAVPPTFGPKTATCTQRTCAEQGKNCGSAYNGCGGELLCGSCAAGEVCGGGGSANVCGAGAACATESDTEFCVRHGSECTLTSIDNCGVERTVVCGSCPSGACVPQSDADFCSTRHATCGSLETPDNCGEARIVVCGICASTQGCVENQCVAKPTLISADVTQIRQGRGITGGDGPARITISGSGLATLSVLELTNASQTLTPMLVSIAATSVVFDVSVPHGTTPADYTLTASTMAGTATLPSKIKVTPITALAVTGFDNGAGTPSSPFKTFAKAAAMASDGDTIELMDGVYDAPNGDFFTPNDAGGGGFPSTAVAPTFNGSAITVRAQHARGATLKGTSTASFGVFVRGTQSITIEGLLIQFFERGVLVQDTATVTLVNVQLDDNHLDDLLAIGQSTAIVSSSDIGKLETAFAENVAGLSILEEAKLSCTASYVGGAQNPLLVKQAAFASVSATTFIHTGANVNFAAVLVKDHTFQNAAAVKCTGCTLNVGPPQGLLSVCRSDVAVGRESDGVRWAIWNSVPAGKACIDFSD